MTKPFQNKANATLWIICYLNVVFDFKYKKNMIQCQVECAY